MQQQKMYSVSPYPNLRLKLTLAIVLACAAAPLLQGQDRNALIEQAVTALRNQQPDAAISILEQLIKAEPNDYKALTLLGIALSADGRGQDAVQTFEHALQVRPE